MKSIFNYPLENLKKELVCRNFKNFNAVQIFEFLYGKKYCDFNLMHNLSNDLKNYLNDNFEIKLLEIVKVSKATDGTIKFLLKLNDNNLIESVLMPQKYGLSLCVSSEVGCLVGCAFCASGLFGRKRSLLTSEMVLQILTVENYLKTKIKSVVIMGIGEPFLNFDNLINFIKILNEPKAFNMGARHITVSTSGIVPKIIEFANLNLQVNLAISLHASTNEKRNKLIPINHKYNLNQLIEAIKYYLSKVKRRVTIEYILLREVNDSILDMQNLTKLFKGLNVYFNLIPYNEVKENIFKRSKKEVMLNCLNYLKQNGFDATLRKEFGKSIDAACGQLRNKYE